MGFDFGKVLSSAAHGIGGGILKAEHSVLGEVGKISKLPGKALHTAENAVKTVAHDAQQFVENAINLTRPGNLIVIGVVCVAGLMLINQMQKRR